MRMRPILAMLIAAAVLGSSAAAADDDAVDGPPLSARAAEPAPALVLPPSVTDGFVASGAGKQAVPPLAGATPPPQQQRPAKPDSVARHAAEGFWPNIRLHGSFGFGR
jgi:hypothetical protein